MIEKNFLWGGASAANQYEGGYDQGNRGESIIDYMPGGKARMQLAMTGKTDINNRDEESYVYPNHRAVEGYEHYLEDIDYMHEMGFNVYRMSISWTRIFPTGFEDKPNQEGIDFYMTILRN